MITLDPWRLATTDDDGTAPIGLGRTDAETLRKQLGLPKKSWTLSARALDGWPAAETGDTYFQFDPEGRLAGINYGFRAGDRLTEAVEQAVSGTDCNGLPPKGPIAVCGSAELRFDERSLDRFATLPRFSGLLPDGAKVALAGRAYDKWLRVTVTARLGIVAAEFLLKTIKTPFAETFDMDYCLYGLSFMSHAALGKKPKTQTGGRSRPSGTQ